MDWHFCITLLQDAAGAGSPGTTPEPWFDPAAFGAWYGAIAGGGGGALGGLLGAAAGLLAPRGRGRGLVVGGFRVAIGLGLCSLVFGLAALFAGQPYGIWFAPALVGLVLPGTGMALLPVIRRVYDVAEQRRLEAGALRRS